MHEAVRWLQLALRTPLPSRVQGEIEHPLTPPDGRILATAGPSEVASLPHQKGRAPIGHRKIFGAGSRRESSAVSAPSRDGRRCPPVIHSAHAKLAPQKVPAVPASDGRSDRSPRGGMRRGGLLCHGCSTWERVRVDSHGAMSDRHGRVRLHQRGRMRPQPRLSFRGLHLPSRELPHARRLQQTGSERPFGHRRAGLSFDLEDRRRSRLGRGLRPSSQTGSHHVPPTILRGSPRRGG